MRSASPIVLWPVLHHLGVFPQGLVRERLRAESGARLHSALHYSPTGVPAVAQRQARAQQHTATAANVSQTLLVQVQ
jgi:hypothetical protein